MRNLRLALARAAVRMSVEIDNDAQRLRMLRCVGGRDLSVRISGTLISALYLKEDRPVQLGEVQVSSQREFLLVLTSGLDGLDLEVDQEIELVDVGQRYVNIPPVDDDGITTIELGRH